MIKGKLIAVLVAFAAVFTAWTTCSAEDTLFYEQWEYLVNDDGMVTIVDYNGEESEITIPGTIAGKTVLIGNGAFSALDMTSVIILDGVTTIGDDAFECCDSLTTVTIPDSVTTIGKGAFAECEKLTKVNIPENVTFIGREAFYMCKKLEKITIPSGVKTIERSAFESCESMAEVTISEGVECIADEAFFNCGALIDIVLPDGLKTIERSAFSGCDGLTSIHIPDSVTKIEDSAFSMCNSLKEITIPGSVAEIERRMFNSCRNLTDVTLQSGVTAIDDEAFLYCYALKNVNIPDTVESIDTDAFCTAKAIENFYVDENNPNYGSADGSLYDKRNFKMIKYASGRVESEYTVPDIIMSIGRGAFYNSDNLVSVIIPDSVTEIGDEAFYSCDNLAHVDMGDDITSLGVEIFDETAISNDENNWENGVLYVDNCLVDTTKDIIGDYKVKDGTVCIATFAFTSYVTAAGIYSADESEEEDEIDYRFMTSITIPDSVKGIGGYAFGSGDDFVIYGSEGSCAQEYAKENNIRFVSDYALPSLKKSTDGDEVKITLKPQSGVSVPQKAVAVLKKGDDIVNIVECKINSKSITLDLSGDELYTVIYFWDGLGTMQPTDGAIPITFSI